MWSRASIKLKVLAAPLAVILLFVGVSVGAVWLLRSQGEAFRDVVGGAFDAATTTSRISLTVASIHSDLVRHVNLLSTRQSVESTSELRETLAARFDRVEAMLQSVETNAPAVDKDLLHDVADFLSIYRTVATRVTQAQALNPTLISTLMAHYSQLDAYLNRLAEVTILAAKERQRRTEALVDRTVNVLLLGVAITVAIGLAATWLIGRAISRPLTEMTGVMSRLAEGEYNIQVPAMARQDEVGSMAGAVEVFREATMRLHQRETELAHTVEHLAIMRDQANEASRAKSEFLANMSHELRTPLNAILGYAQILQWEASMGNKQLAGLATIEKSGQHLLTLIDDILDLSKIEAGKRELQLAPLALGPFLRGIVDIIQVRTEQKHLVFVYESNELPASVDADEKQLRQVLLNLLGNATKFTDQGEVSLRVKLLSGADQVARLRFEVRDSGIGIGEADMKTLFQPFRQVGDIERRRGGTGLGLAISRQLVRLMGSDIEVTSTPGQGSVFAFELRLPLAEAQASLPADRIALGYDGERKKVLVVDDVAENRALLIDMLRPLGFLTFEAHNGREGVERAQALLPDLILMDNVMPVMNGLEATRLLRATPALKDVPVLAISASASQADREMAVDAGATDFVSKPFRAAQLLALFERHLGIRFHTR
ncbi:ATP-binding protein [Piscinibacter sp.]|jgi:signal transduction histidine kinase/ActR/RegA family two-component response regulator|uniref:ATP-binding protein n=1 Tax=Piscinibacter sp. TaxID=1903157 RepID=UPI002F3F37F2